MGWLGSALWILLGGLFAGQLAKRLGAPALLGMVLVGIVLGPQLGNVISPDVLAAADGLRTVAVIVILMKAGLGLDLEKLAQQGTVALRLGFLPAACEAIAVAFGAMWLFQFDFLPGLLLGCVVGAESPAVIVPGMLRLKQLGWGVRKGIPDAILMGSALSDVLLLLVFSLLLAFLSQDDITGVTLSNGLSLGPLQLLPFQVVLQVVLGIFLGRAAAQFLSYLLGQRRWTQNQVQETLVAAICALALVLLATRVPLFSGYLAVMSTGFFLAELNTPVARRLREGFNSLWVVAEIVLFVLLGASIQVGVLSLSLLSGLLLLAIGTLVGRSLGWYLSTLGSDWTLKERLFLLPGNSAKATVQAAIGAIPLAQGIEGGEIILAIAALSILVTAPLGAWAIPTFAPKLLERGKVDPTKVAIAPKMLFLAAIDASAFAIPVLTKAAELARHIDGEVIVLYVREKDSPELTLQLRLQAQRLLADVRHQFLAVSGLPSAEILRASRVHSVDEIIIGKRGYRTNHEVLIGSVARAVLSNSCRPVLTVDISKEDSSKERTSYGVSSNKQRDGI